MLSNVGLLMIQSWMVIAGVTVLVVLGANLLSPRDGQWFRRLRRPRWLVFEPLIPAIWTIVFISGARSAYLVWERDPGSDRTGWLMLFYLVLEIVIVAYNPITLRTRNLTLGTWVGGIGFLLGVILFLLVGRISGQAALLLLPYLLWSPIGTYTTWVLGRLNPAFT